MNKKLNVIAYYLPQYHTIPENDKWWGDGFTEWVNVKKAKPLFKDHKQPNIPAPELGYYNLLDDNVRRKQSELAKEAGIDGFCYWHYWFGGEDRQLLEKPFEMTLKDKENKLGFCLGWANESWKAKQWNKDGSGDVTLMEQRYLGEEDDTKHFYAFLDAFRDERYMKNDGRPIFLIYKPLQHPYISKFISLWNQLAKINGFEDGFCFIAELGSHYKKEDLTYLINSGFNFVTLERSDMGQAPFLYKCYFVIKNYLLNRPKRVIDYKELLSWAYTKRDNIQGILPGICPNWDHSPRSGRKCSILHNSTPELFYKLVRKTLMINNKNRQLPIMFIKSWNEWGEGNYLEPDTVFGKKYIYALRRALKEEIILSDETERQ